jgi:hypothetical protein
MRMIWERMLRGEPLDVRTWSTAAVATRKRRGPSRNGAGYGARAERRGPSCVSSSARSPCAHADARLGPEGSGHKIMSRSRLPSLPALPFLPPSRCCSSYPRLCTSPRPQPRKRRPPAVRSRSSARHDARWHVADLRRLARERAWTRPMSRWTRTART